MAGVPPAAAVVDMAGVPPAAVVVGVVVVLVVAGVEEGGGRGSVWWS
jgi:hypothetical protein